MHLPRQAQSFLLAGTGAFHLPSVASLLLHPQHHLSPSIRQHLTIIRIAMADKESLLFTKLPQGIRDEVYRFSFEEDDAAPIKTIPLSQWIENDRMDRRCRPDVSGGDCPSIANCLMELTVHCQAGTDLSSPQSHDQPSVLRRSLRRLVEMPLHRMPP